MSWNPTTVDFPRKYLRSCIWRKSISKLLPEASAEPQRPLSLNPIPISAASEHPAAQSDSAHAPLDIFSSRKPWNRPISRSADRQTSHLLPALSEFQKSGPPMELSVQAAAATSSLSSPAFLKKMLSKWFCAPQTCVAPVSCSKTHSALPSSSP